MPARRALSALALCGALLAATGAGADIIRKEDMLRGITMTRAQCAAIERTVWVNVDGHDFCVRYYLSTAGGEGARPVVFLQGDYLGKLDGKTRTWVDPADTTDINTDDLVRLADGFSKLAKTTAIYLARIGVEGTSGNHVSRRTHLELHLMNAALDVIERRHGFEGFHLAGQSGGSKLVAGLIGMRRDVACAVSGSGPLTVPGTNGADPARTYFGVVDAIPQLARNNALRILVVTDPADTKVPAVQQIGFVDQMREAGRPIPQFFVEATDDHHHGVRAYAELVMGGCVLGKSDEEIARAVATLVKRNTEYNERRRNEARAKAAPGTAARQPASDPRTSSGAAQPRAAGTRG
jgi:hypothetical protein